MKKTAWIFLTILLISMSGCYKPAEIIKDSEIINGVKDTIDFEKVKEIITDKFEESEQIQILKEYYTYIEKRIDEDEILEFLKNNITGMEDFRVDEMLIELEKHLYVKGYDTKGVLEKLAPHIQYASDEFKSYFRIWNKEVYEETTDGEALTISLEELLGRALDVEEHLNRFPEGKTKSRLTDLYESYIIMSIQGLGNPYIFAEEGEGDLNPDSKRIYEESISNNPDSRTAKILQKYLEELEKDKFELNGKNANFFYDNIDRIVESID